MRLSRVLSSTRDRRGGERPGDRAGAGVDGQGNVEREASPFAAAHRCEQAIPIQRDDLPAVDHRRWGTAKGHATAAQRDAALTHRLTIDLDIEPSRDRPAEARRDLDG